jgi:hypothetical protein
MDYTCKWCKKSFARERTLSSHMCEKKRRWAESDSRESQLAFNVWNDFRKHVSPNIKKDKSIEDFIQSKDYVAFIKFARHLIDLRPIDPNAFIKWLFKMGIDMRDWSKAGTYYLYQSELNKKETVERAVERSVLFIEKWSTENGYAWRNFFKRVPVVSAMNFIVMGRISPWLLYALDSAQEMLGRMEPGQLEYIARSIDTEWWHEKINKNPDQVQWIRTILEN